MIRAAVLAEATGAKLARVLEMSPREEPILVIDAGRHGLVSDDFVRNASPDRLTASQDGLPLALRDADIAVDLRDGVPRETAMILRTDRRLGSDLSRPWTHSVEPMREHGMFQPEIGRVTLTAEHQTPGRFFLRDGEVAPLSPAQEALRSRAGDLATLGEESCCWSGP